MPEEDDGRSKEKEKEAAIRVGFGLEVAVRE